MKKQEIVLEDGKKAVQYCHAGISRSTAVGLGIQAKPGRLRSIRSLRQGLLRRRPQISGRLEELPGLLGQEERELVEEYSDELIAKGALSRTATRNS
jgi:hypothetical protein